jgi:hypothetical protein
VVPGQDIKGFHPVMGTDIGDKRDFQCLTST